MSEYRTRIEEIVRSEPVALFMKGTPAQPKCGFSAAVVDILNTMHVPYVGIDAIEDPRFRQVLSAHTQWPTLPQVFVGGELVGGADIVEELERSGELEQALVEKLGENYWDARGERTVTLT